MRRKDLMNEHFQVESAISQNSRALYNIIEKCWCKSMLPAQSGNKSTYRPNGKF